MDVEPARLEGELGDADRLPLAVAPEREDPQLGARAIEPLEAAVPRLLRVVPVEEQGAGIARQPDEHVVAVAPGKVAQPLVVGGDGDVGESPQRHRVLPLLPLGHGVGRLPGRLLPADAGDEVAVRVEPSSHGGASRRLATRCPHLGGGLRSLPRGRLLRGGAFFGTAPSSRRRLLRGRLHGDLRNLRRTLPGGLRSGLRRRLPGGLLRCHGARRKGCPMAARQASRGRIGDGDFRPGWDTWVPTASANVDRNPGVPLNRRRTQDPGARSHLRKLRPSAPSRRPLHGGAAGRGRHRDAGHDGVGGGPRRGPASHRPAGGIDRGELPGGPGAGPGRHGHGLPGRAPGHRQPGRHQVPPRVDGRQPRAGGAASTTRHGR